jgi:hypothetical protein
MRLPSPLLAGVAAVVGGVLLLPNQPRIVEQTAAPAPPPIVEPLPRKGTPAASPSASRMPAKPTMESIIPAPLPRKSPDAAPAVAPKASVPVPDALPVGKGMWIWLPDRAEGGNARRIVDRALGSGLTHLYVQTGSSKKGFIGGHFLESLLPYAHARGLRVYGWDFPELDDVNADIHRARTAISFRARGGHRIDGFVPDIETPSEGTNSGVHRVASYANGLRAAVGSSYPLIACVPRPSPRLERSWPYAEAIRPMSAVAPMVYWLNRQPDSDVAGAIQYLSRFRKPIIPIGQAYDGGPEGGRPGPPRPDEIRRFADTAAKFGATGVSFWSWQHASLDIWRTIDSMPAFKAGRTPPPKLSKHATKRLQHSISKIGLPVPVSGNWDPATVEAVRAFQRRQKLEVTGTLDPVTVDAMRRTGVALPSG